MTHFKNFITYWTRRLSHPVRGFVYALKKDSAFQIEFFGGFLILCAIHVFLGPFNPREQLLLIFGWFFVMVTELQNSSIEIALDKIHPERHEEIRKSKDLASAAVVWAGVFSLISFFYILGNAF